MKTAVIVVLFVFAFLLFVFMLPIKLGFKAYVDVVENIGAYCFRLFGLRVLCGRMKVDHHKLVFENQHHRLENNKKAPKILPLFSSELYKNMDVVAIDMCFEGGKKDDAFASAMICGSFETLLSIVFSYLKTKNINGSFRKNVQFVPNFDLFNITLDGAVAVTLFDVAKSFVSARIKLSKTIQTNG